MDPYEFAFWRCRRHSSMGALPFLLVVVSLFFLSLIFSVLFRFEDKASFKCGGGRLDSIYLVFLFRSVVSFCSFALFVIEVNLLKKKKI